MTNTMPGFPENISVPKDQARRLVRALEDQLKLSHAQSLEVIAKVHGQQSWGHMRAVLEEKTTSPTDVTVPRSSSDVVLRDVLLVDFWRMLDAHVHEDFLVSRAVSALENVWVQFVLSGNQNKPAPRISRDALHAEIQTVQTDNSNPLQETVTSLVMDAFDRLYELTMPVFSHTRRWPETQNRLRIEGFGSRNERKITWAQAAEGCRHAILYTHNLNAAIKEMMDTGLHVHDLAHDKDWSRLVRIFGGVSGRYALGSTGFSQLLGTHSQRVLDMREPLPASRPVQVVLLSMRECLITNPDVLLAQARAFRVHVMIHWDLGGSPDLSWRQRDHLLSMTANTMRSLVHDKDGVLRVHRDATQTERSFR